MNLVYAFHAFTLEDADLDLLADLDEADLDLDAVLVDLLADLDEADLDLDAVLVDLLADLDDEDNPERRSVDDGDGAVQEDFTDNAVDVADEDMAGAALFGAAFLPLAVLDLFMDMEEADLDLEDNPERRSVDDGDGAVQEDFTDNAVDVEAEDTGGVLFLGLETTFLGLAGAALFGPAFLPLAGTFLGAAFFFNGFPLAVVFFCVLFERHPLPITHVQLLVELQTSLRSVEHVTIILYTF